MSKPWGADVHGGLRVYYDAHGKARYSAEAGVDVQDDVRANIAMLRVRADALERWMLAWSTQEEANNAAADRTGR